MIKITVEITGPNLNEEAIGRFHADYYTEHAAWLKSLIDNQWLLNEYCFEIIPEEKITYEFFSVNEEKAQKCIDALEDNHPGNGKKLAEKMGHTWTTLPFSVVDFDTITNTTSLYSVASNGEILIFGHPKFT